MVYKFFGTKIVSATVKNEIMQNKELVEKLHELIIRKLWNWKVHLSFIDNIWGADLVDMQLLSKINKGIHFLLCVIDIYSVNMLGLFLWKIKKVLQLLMLFKQFYISQAANQAKYG